MKYTILLILTAVELMAAMLKTEVLSIDEKEQTIKVKAAELQEGVSGFVVHHITPKHSAILKSAFVKEYDAATQTATLQLGDFLALRNNSLPYGKWNVAVGDTVELAFAYSRALLIAPSEELYHKITKSVQVQWIHPDLFATVLSFVGHPTPLKSDFARFGNTASVGLVFIYLEGKIFTVDIQTLKILNITKTPLLQKKEQTPFYTRVQNIDAAWWGEGSDEMEAYAPHYYELLASHNKKNKALYEIIKNSEDETIQALGSVFEIGE
jgi:hypothetical protein